MRLIREPLVQFLVLGALIFAVYPFSNLAKWRDAERSVVVDAATEQWLYENYERQFRRPPTRVDMDAMVEDHVESEIKYREAMAMGLDKGDMIVQRRLVQKFDFLFGNAAADSEPDEPALREWYEKHTGEFAQPGTVSFTQLWFSPDRRANTAGDAQAALETLRQGGEVQADRFPFDSVFETATPDEVRKTFGPGFAQAVFKAPLNAWSGPIKSGLGVHLVRVTARTDGKTPSLEEVRDSVLAHWRVAESERLLNAHMETLRANYDERIDRDSLDKLDYSR